MHSQHNWSLSKWWLGAILALAVVMALRLDFAHAAAGDVVADRVLGQPDCAHSNSSCNSMDQDALSSPNAVAIDKSVTPNRVYVADTSNNRVLGFHSITALVNGANADLVIGAPDFFSGAGFGTNQRTLNGPRAVAVDKLGNLFVGDSGNNRVLEYEAPFNAATDADRVYGQPLFTTNIANLGGITATSLNGS